MTASTTDRPRVATWVDGDARDARARRASDRRLRRILRRGVHVPRPPMPSRALSWWRELLFVAVLYVSYEFTRGLHHGGLGQALTNGRTILDWEGVLHLDPEHALNQLLAHTTSVAVFAAYFYSTMHYLVTPAVLIWMYRTHAAHYRRARTALAIATITGLVGFYLAPTAPPRLLPDGAFRDTLADVSNWGWWSTDGSVPRGLGGLSNQFAAMPSLHVGWALWSGVLIAMFAAHRVVRWLGALYPVVTGLVVMATGNHYLLDVLAGVAVIAWGWIGAVLLERWRRRIRVPAS
jgi:hypothetical protein